MDMTISVGNLTDARLLQLREALRANPQDNGTRRLSPLRDIRSLLSLPAGASRGDVLAELNQRLRHVDRQSLEHNRPTVNDPSKVSQLSDFLSKQIAEAGVKT